MLWMLVVTTLWSYGGVQASKVEVFSNRSSCEVARSALYQSGFDPESVSVSQIKWYDCYPIPITRERP